MDVSPGGASLSEPSVKSMFDTRQDLGMEHVMAEKFRTIMCDWTLEEFIERRRNTSLYNFKTPHQVGSSISALFEGKPNPFYTVKAR